MGFFLCKREREIFASFLISFVRVLNKFQSFFSFFSFSMLSFIHSF